MDVYGRFAKVSFKLLDNKAGFYDTNIRQCLIRVTVAIDKGYGFQTGPYEAIVSFNLDGKDFALDIPTTGGKSHRFFRYVTREMQERLTP